jgi:hypothetical protein
LFILERTVEWGYPATIGPRASENLIPHPRRSMLPAAVACTIITLGLMVWPGDAPWGGDDVVLISTAITANQQHRLVEAGLGGSFGYPYGPLPENIYQLLAIASHDPIVLVRLHAGLFAAATSAALLMLSCGMGLTPWLAPMMMLGPFFWFYDRLLWDNTFAIPIGTLMLAAYGLFLRGQSRWAFLTAMGCAIALPLVHPMTLPLVLPVLGHSVWFHRSAFVRHWIGWVTVAGVGGFISWHYALRVARQLRDSPALLPPRSDALRFIQGLEYPLFSGRLFSAFGFIDARGPEHGLESTALGIVARDVSAVAFPLLGLGLIVTVVKLFHRAGGSRPGMTPDRAGPALHLTRIALVALILQALMDAALHISPYPQYYCGTWPAAVLLIWLGVQSIRPKNVRITIGVVYALSLLLSTVLFAIDIHRQHGGAVWYGPSIGSQLDHR